MSDAQRKIIGFIALAGLCAFVEVAALTAEMQTYDITCAYDDKPCDEPAPDVATALGTYPLPDFVTAENFEQYKWGTFGVAMLLEVASALMIVKTLREQEVERKKLV